MSNFRKILWLIVLGYLLWLMMPVLQQLWISSQATPRTIEARGDLADDEKSTIALFEKTSPSVVFISTSQRVRDYWTRNILNVPRGTGSGFVWDQYGHIVTNNHVIAGASVATVRLNDGRSFDAKLVGTSPSHDIAVLRIDVPSSLPPAIPLGTSADLKVGQKVFAIGNPFGLDYTLTSGLVSALNRSLASENQIPIDNLIQTDAAINPGNSGGPLLDSAGRLIGINTAIYSPSGAYAGIGFSVPVDIVNKVVPQLIKFGKYTRPSLGISVDENINRQIMRQLGVSGVAILDFSRNSAAKRAGLQAVEVNRYGKITSGDIITAIDGKSVESVNTLLSILDDYSFGDEVTLDYIRAGNTQRLTLKFADA